VHTDVGGAARAGEGDAASADEIADEGDAASADVEPAGGCQSTTGGAPWLLALALALVAVRRRRRARDRASRARAAG
jgi:MYXO-CTERM domain-containing protein